MQCSALRALSDVYGPWTSALYARLRYDAHMRRAPVMEGTFEPFESPPCTEEELPPVNVTWCSCDTENDRLRHACGKSNGAKQ